ncbi:MAG TPA: cupin-like domain-containing protein, partial [Thermoanaerobaculia bacterium]|nr:cupin-like domain-containing protein [Thermoanaerobaculia bacterium]
MDRVLEIDREELERSFDRRPFVVRHRVEEEPLFTIPALIELARRLPECSVEYQSGRVPVGLDPAAAPKTGLSLTETLERIEDCASWVVLKHVEQVPEYRTLMDRALSEVAETHSALCGAVLDPAAFVFVSSAASVTPYHIDPEHNFLLQIRGRKTMYVWSPEDREALPEEEIERFHAGGHRNLAFSDRLQEKAAGFDLTPGDALHVPVTAPHWVRNGETVSISLSVTFRTPASYRREVLYRVNAHLR